MSLSITNTTLRLTRARWLAGILLIISSFIWTNQQLLIPMRVSQPLPVHTFLETVTIVIFASVFIVCWNAFGDTRKKSSAILAIAFLCTAILGFFHSMSFQGMPGFETTADMHKSLSFWLASRSIIAVTLFGLALDPTVKGSPIRFYPLGLFVRQYLPPLFLARHIFCPSPIARKVDKLFLKLPTRWGWSQLTV